MRPTLLLDVDGIIADFETAFLEVARDLTGRDIVRDPTQWCMEAQCRLTEEEAGEVWSVIHGSRFARDLDPYPFAVDNVKSLSELCNVYFVTSPMEENPTWAHDRALWLRSHFGDELGSKVISTKHKHCVRGNVFVDDKPEHIEQWSRAHGDGAAFLWNRAYNSEIELPRVRSWRELHTVVHQLQF